MSETGWLSFLHGKKRSMVPLVAAGLTNREIAAMLGTTEMTVKRYLQDIFDKLGVWNRVELAVWYVRNVELKR